ncbi:MAG: hypothetical protein WKF79_00505 [Nocardioides sp.]
MTTYSQSQVDAVRAHLVKLGVGTGMIDAVADYRPRNRSVPVTLAFSVGPDRVPFFVDDVDSYGTATGWGRVGSPIRVLTYHGGRFVICDDRGRFLKNARCYRGEGKRRVRTFRTAVEAALFSVTANVADCA